jgi:transmembrane protein 126A
MITDCQFSSFEFINFQTVQANVMLRRYDCPMCLQTRAGLLQTSFAVLYPFCLAPVAAFMYATRHFTYKLPSLTEQPKEVFKLWMKFTRSATTLTGFLIAANMLAAMYITSKEQKEHLFVNLQLLEHEKKVESGSLTEEELEQLKT